MSIPIETCHYSALAVVTVCLVGCGDGLKRTDVAGQVKLDDQPVAEGVVLFHPETGGTSFNATLTQGRFELRGKEGIVPGKYKVDIHLKVPTGRMVRDADIAGQEVQEMRQLLRTGLQAEVPEEGVEDLEFALTTKRGRSRRQR